MLWVGLTAITVLTHIRKRGVSQRTPTRRLLFLVKVYRRGAGFFVIKKNNAPTAVRPIGSQRTNWQLNS
jgi:hypothetical protein